MSYIEKATEPDVPYNKWDDAAFVAEMDRRVTALEDGTDKGSTWEEVKERAKLNSSETSHLEEESLDYKIVYPHE